MAVSCVRSSRRTVLMTQLEDRRLLSAAVFDVVDDLPATDAAPQPEIAMHASQDNAAFSAEEYEPATPRAAASDVVRRVTEADELVPGDFDADGDTDAADIDLLGQALKNDVSDLRFDLNRDGKISVDDMDVMIHDILNTHYGDANLDLRVDHRDLEIIQKHMFQHVSSWSQGDFNLDGAVDGSDFNVWNGHKQTIDANNEHAPTPMAAEMMPVVPTKVTTHATLRIDTQPSASFRMGDLDQDGDIDANDIDLLARTMNNDPADRRFDLNRDGELNAGDMDTLIHDILGTEYGDANLDGRVDELDAKPVRDHFFQFVTGWSHGDFNFDGRVDGSDFNIWNAQKLVSGRIRSMTKRP